MNNQRRLGRGLEALLGRPLNSSGDAGLDVVSPPVAGPDAPYTGGLVHLNVYQIEGNPYQPRQDFDEAEIDSLAESLKEHGLIQPIVVRRRDERFELISGERRLRAAIKAGWTEVPAQIREADDRQVAELAIVENLQRKDLNALEKAASFQQYLRRYGCTQEELAGRLQIDRSTIANLIRLLELPTAVQDAIRRGAITQGHARAMLPLGDEKRQVELAQRIQAEGLSVRVVEELVQETIRVEDAVSLPLVAGDAPEGRQKRPPRRTRSPQIASLEQELRAALGTKVDIRQNARGRGRITIHFTTHEEFDRLRGHLTGPHERRDAV